MLRFPACRITETSWRQMLTGGLPDLEGMAAFDERDDKEALAGDVDVLTQPDFYGAGS